MSQLDMLLMEELRKALDRVAKAYTNLKFHELPEPVKKDLIERAHKVLGNY